MMKVNIFNTVPIIYLFLFYFKVKRPNDIYGEKQFMQQGNESGVTWDEYIRIFNINTGLLAPV